MTKLFKYLSLAFVALALFATSCSENSEGDQADATYKATIKNDAVVGRIEGVTTIYLSGEVGDTWSVEITKNPDGWCGLDYSFDKQIASGTLNSGVNSVFLYYKSNFSQESRGADIVVKFGNGESVNLKLSQLVENIFTRKYSELPAYDDRENYLYATHYTTSAIGEPLRNYSVCFDTELKTSLWVAYPLHKVYFGSYERQDDWSFDPKLPSKYQQDCRGGSYGDAGDYSNYDYDRGHQLPSADRKANEDMNEQTCFMSNITPQTATFNRNLWKTIETQVRSYVCNDTLFVVTGAYFDPSVQRRYTKDNVGGSVPVPTNYFKAFVRTRKGDTNKRVADCAADELKGICFWVENSNDNGSKINASMFKSIDEVEDIIGFDLFPTVTNLDETQCVTADWGY